MRAPLRKRALLVGVAEYADHGYSALRSARVDVEAMRSVLEHPKIGAFEVSIVNDPDAATLRQRIEEFLGSAEPDELVLLYVSGHGTRLSHSTSEFVFIASDTDSERVQQTGVLAGFVNDQLYLCRARQKVAVLDCCRSGGFAVRLETRAAKSEAAVPLNAEGVYVLSSSGAGEDSYAGRDLPDGTVGPSVFTEEIVEALRTGHADASGDGRITVEELFDHVAESMGHRELRTTQRPVKSAVQVNGRIDLAASYNGQPLPFSMIARRDDRGTRRSSPPESLPTPLSTVHGGPWASLLDYYRRCINAEADDVPIPTADQAGTDFVYLGGVERILSGDMDETATVPAGPDAASLAVRAAGQDSELWYGYPAVVLSVRKKSSVTNFPAVAPLLVRRVRLVDGATGARLQPYGPVQPNPQLARRVLGDEDAERLAETYRQSWVAGWHDRMVADIRYLLINEFEVECVDALRSRELRDGIDLRTPADGARNVAMLVCAPRTKRSTDGLLRDIAEIEKHERDITGTALAALLDHDDGRRSNQQGGTRVAATPVVAPLALNEGQSEIIRAAMSRRLTVATGPPGTGKSQLVVNAVATAIADGQSVLVASNNNQAVDEVSRRCDELVRGMVVRTGNRDNRDTESETLRHMSTQKAARATFATARAEFNHAVAERNEAADIMSATAGREAELLELGRRRERLAGKLGLRSAELSGRIGDDVALRKGAARVERAARATVFGSWRRRRMMNGLQLDGDPTRERCRDVADWFDVELSWRDLCGTQARAPSDIELSDLWERRSHTARAVSRELLDTAIRNSASAGESAIRDLLAPRPRGQSDWGAVRKAVKHVRGWAVTCLSARRFPPTPGLFDLVIIDEASQCATPQVLPLLYRAKRALIIGDPMQLRPVVTLNPENEALARRGAGIDASWLEDRQLDYHRHSAFHAFEHVAGKSLLLDEHFRCHPRIADVSNRLFYGNSLTVLTRTREQRSVERCSAVRWSDVRGMSVRPPSGKSWINKEEAERISECVSWFLDYLPEGGDVGVVTPFRPQADLVNERWHGNERVQVGTVNTFQGGERDAIVLSLVATDGMSRSSVAWLSKNLNLWNVAMTRARAHLVVVGHRDFWESQGASPPISQPRQGPRRTSTRRSTTIFNGFTVA